MTAILQEKFERRLEAAMNLIKEYGVSYRQIGILESYEKIVLHVAEWNQNAENLYLKNGFSVNKKEKVR